MKYCIVDAFTTTCFSGNPAAVVFLTNRQSDTWLQALAAEFNLSETAYLTHQHDNHWQLRWFTPAVEVDLCGHATLASALALWKMDKQTPNELHFHTRSGCLSVKREGDFVVMDFPVVNIAPLPEAKQAEVRAALDIPIVNMVQAGKNILAELSSAEAVKSFSPPLAEIRKLSTATGGVIITARGNTREIDFVSRFFVPNAGVDEDPVTGSIHCALTPYWSQKLNRSELCAHQLSSRGGRLKLDLQGERVFIKGQGVIVMQGDLNTSELLAQNPPE